MTNRLVGAALLIGLMTLVWRDWIEAFVGVDPDNHSGILEWLIVLGLLLAAAVVVTAARYTWRRLQPSTGTSSAS